MGRGSRAAREHAELTRAGFGVRDQLGDRSRRNRRVHDEDESVAGDACDSCDVTDEIEIELVIEGRIDGVWYATDEERVPICRRTHHCLGGEIAAGPWPILDHERLAEPLRHHFSN